MARPKKPLGFKTKLIIFLVIMAMILAFLWGSGATIQGLIPVDAMRDPHPFRQSCDIKMPEDETSGIDNL